MQGGEAVPTECSKGQIEFVGFGSRRVVAGFDAGRTSSDGGLLLVREVAERTGLLRRFAACFTDHRKPEAIEHSVESLVSQRVLGLACGYEDLNDHDTLRSDVLLAMASGKEDPTGERRARLRDRGHALAGKSTLNRLELSPPDANRSHRYKKIVYDGAAIDRLLVDVFLDAHKRAPARIVLDLDATDDPLHGKQEGRFFHGYYGQYCYLPLYIFCGDFLLAARLRPSNIDASAGALEEVERIVSQIRHRWPKVQVVLRADSGFARDAIMHWCEANRVDFVFGLARNARLEKEIAEHSARAKKMSEVTGKPAREYKDFRYQTLNSWSRERRVIGKAEHIPGKSNPRFVVTSLPARTHEARQLYELLYCARGDMENRIKEQQMGLFADRTSTHTLRANQLRLWFSSVAYVLLNELRRTALARTELRDAQVWTLRTRLLKIAAIVRVSVRRVSVAFSSAFPLKHVMHRALEDLAAQPAAT